MVHKCLPNKPPLADHYKAVTAKHGVEVTCMYSVYGDSENLWLAGIHIRQLTDQYRPQRMHLYGKIFRTFVP